MGPLFPINASPPKPAQRDWSLVSTSEWTLTSTDKFVSQKRIHSHLRPDSYNTSHNLFIISILVVCLLKSRLYLVELRMYSPHTATRFEV